MSLVDFRNFPVMVWSKPVRPVEKKSKNEGRGWEKKGIIELQGVQQQLHKQCVRISAFSSSNHTPPPTQQSFIPFPTMLVDVIFNVCFNRSCATAASED